MDCPLASVYTGLFQRAARPLRDDVARPRRARQEKLMETRSNNVLVGAFVLFFTLAIAIFVVWMANDSGGAKREYDIFFKQSVDGLSKGSQVQFSGVPVGQVDRKSVV